MPPACRQRRQRARPRACSRSVARSERNLLRDFSPEQIPPVPTRCSGGERQKSNSGRRDASSERTEPRMLLGRANDTLPPGFGQAEAWSNERGSGKSLSVINSTINIRFQGLRSRPYAKSAPVPCPSVHPSDLLFVGSPENADARRARSRSADVRLAALRQQLPRCPLPR